MYTRACQPPETGSREILVVHVPIVSWGTMHLWYPPESAIPSAPLMMWATSGGCLRREAQIALTAVCEPTIETNQRPSVASSRAKASAVAENPPAEMV